MVWRAVSPEEGMEPPKKQKMLDRFVVTGVTILCAVIVVALVIFVVVEKLKQKAPTALVLLPNPFDDHLIRFQPENNGTYEYYVSHLNEYLHTYNNSQSQDPLAVNCSAGSCPTGSKVCLFDIERLGHHCHRENKYGFHEGRPCVLIFLKPPDDWEPVNFNRSSVPNSLEDRWSPLHLGIHCEGQTEADNQYMGRLEYWPPEGFPMVYFPYPRKPNFRPPLMMLRFMNPSPDVLIRVKCQLHAVNISPQKNQLYTNQFDIYLEREPSTNYSINDGEDSDNSVGKISEVTTEKTTLFSRLNNETIDNGFFESSTMPLGVDLQNTTNTNDMTDLNISDSDSDSNNKSSNVL